MMRGPRRPSVRARLLLALVALAAATLIVGATSWITLGRATVGTAVNLEVDVIAKYVERLLSHRDQSTG